MRDSYFPERQSTNLSYNTFNTSDEYGNCQFYLFIKKNHQQKSLNKNDTPCSFLSKQVCHLSKRRISVGYWFPYAYVSNSHVDATV